MPEPDKNKDGDGNTNADGNTNKDGNKDGDKGGGDKGKSDGGKNTSDTFEIKVNGEVRHLTLAELTEAASKTVGADARFEEASSMRKSATAGLQALEVIGKIKGTDNPKPEDVEAFFHLMGIADSNLPDIKELLGGKTPVKDKSDGKTDGNTDKGDQTPAKIGLDNLDDRTRRAVEAAEKQELGEIRGKIEEEVKKGVDNDEILGKIVDELASGVDKEAKGKFVDVIHQMAVDSARLRILSGELFGADMVKSIAQKVRTTVKEFGIPVKKADNLPVTGLGPILSLSPDVLSDKPIERVESSADDYVDNVTKRYLQKQNKAMQSR